MQTHHQTPLSCSAPSHRLERKPRYCPLLVITAVNATTINRYFRLAKSNPGSDVSHKGRTGQRSRGEKIGAASPQPPRARSCSRPAPSRRPGGSRVVPQGKETGGRESGRAAPGPSQTHRGRSNPVPPPPPPLGPPGGRGATAAARAGPGGVSAAAAMGWEEVQVRGYPEFVRTAQSHHGRPIFALFCGDKDAEGRSWCPDCVTGEDRAGSALRAAWAVSLLGKPERLWCLSGEYRAGSAQPQSQCPSRVPGAVSPGELNGF